MTDFGKRRYKNHQLNLEGNTSNYSVKIFAVSGVQRDNYSDELYKTPPYEEANEAFTHAYAWLDCGLRTQADPNKKEDSPQEAYSKVKEHQGEFYSPWYKSEEEKKRVLQEEEKASERQKEVWKKQKEVWEERLKTAYNQGWEAYEQGREKKLIDRDVDN
ncbi:hypothetical protein QUA41_29145 [Microcoleus sp. Pol11C1]|uniref:hypothetical protein n=1 Tax=unclassified Microcoleus TaxID=2642155 RepID=UPI002FD11AB8